MSASEEWQTAVNPGLPGVFRYLPLLGIGDETAELLADPEGAEVRRPIEAPDLARRLGVASMHLLPCDGGPSGTFKDAEAAVVIARQLERRGGAERIVFASSGNTARAYRGYALRAGIASTACLPAAGLEKLRGLGPDERS
jgi:threonine synthase